LRFRQAYDDRVKMTRRPTMFRTLGWAAFLASSTVVLTFACGRAAADAARPTYACFSAQNAAIIGRLGANDASVRYAFEIGECLALMPNAPISDGEHTAGLWRFRAFGAKPFLYAADWAAGFMPTVEPNMPVGFERYIPVTARLIAMGRTFADCYEATERLNAHGENWERRMRAYYAQGSKTDLNGPSPVILLYVGDTGPKLMAEGDQIQRDAAVLRRRCSTVAAMEADQDFIAFARTAQV
jgi:hypothetical protein